MLLLQTNGASALQLSDAGVCWVVGRFVKTSCDTLFSRCIRKTLGCNGRKRASVKYKQKKHMTQPTKPEVSRNTANASFADMPASAISFTCIEGGNTKMPWHCAPANAYELMKDLIVKHEGRDSVEYTQKHTGLVWYALTITMTICSCCHFHLSFCQTSVVRCCKFFLLCSCTVVARQPIYWLCNIRPASLCSIWT